MKVSTTLFVLIAATIERCRAVVILNRGTASWTQGRVQALLDAGNITNDMLPDFRAVQPTDFQVDSVMLEWGVEKVRFSISIANIGANNLQARNGAIITNATQAQIDYFNSLGLHVNSVRLASQELMDSNNKIAVSIPDATLSNYHHSHNHIHVAETARFSLEHYNISTSKWVVVPDREALKQYFCLLDSYQFKPVADSTDPDKYEFFFDGSNSSYPRCNDHVQGVSDGFLDYYGAYTPGQEVSICGLPAGMYRLVVTVNPAGWFLESNYSNNVGWASFELTRDDEGKPSVKETNFSNAGIWFDKYGTYPTVSPYPTLSPTKSLNPTTTSSPSLCTGNTPNWTNAYGDGCDWYEEYDLPGCPWLGDRYGTMGVARDNCCYCSSTYSRSPSTSPKPTVSPNPTYGRSPTVSPYPTYGRPPTVSPYPTYAPTTSSDPTTTSRPSTCSDSTPNWTSSYGSTCKDLEYEDPSCENGFFYYSESMGPAAINCCHCFDKVEICTVKSSSSEPTKMPSTSKPTTSKPTTKMVSLLNYDNCER